MKNIFVIGILFIFLFQVGIAQNKKAKPVSKTKKTSTAPYIAYIFEDDILTRYSVVKKVDTIIVKKQNDYQEKFNKMAIDYQMAYLDYQKDLKNLDSVTTESLNAKLKNVKTLKSNAEEFQKTSQKELQQYFGDELAKIKKSIQISADAVAKQKGYKYVFIRQKSENPMTRNRIVLYGNDNGRDNISDAVLENLEKKL